MELLDAQGAAELLEAVSHPRRLAILSELIAARRG